MSTMNTIIEPLFIVQILTFDCLSELISDVLDLEQWVGVILVVFLQGEQD